MEKTDNVQEAERLQPEHIEAFLFAELCHILDVYPSVQQRLASTDPTRKNYLIRAIDNLGTWMEARNADRKKHTIKYDDLSNRHPNRSQILPSNQKDDIIYSLVAIELFLQGHLGKAISGLEIQNQDSFFAIVREDIIKQLSCFRDKYQYVYRNHNRNEKQSLCLQNCRDRLKLEDEEWKEFERFFIEGATENEKKNSYCSLRFINNTVRRSEGDRKEYERFSKTQEHTPFGWKDHLLHLCIGFLVKYHILLHIYTHCERSEEFGAEQADEKLQECKNAFHVIRVLAKYYKEEFEIGGRNYARFIEIRAKMLQGYTSFLMEDYEAAYNDYRYTMSLLSEISGLIPGPPESLSIRLWGSISSVNKKILPAMPSSERLANLLRQYNRLLIPMLQFLIGETYRRDYAYKKSREHYEEGLAQFDRLLDPASTISEEDRLIINQSLAYIIGVHNIGKVEIELGRFSDALLHLMKALRFLLSVILPKKAQESSEQIKVIDESLERLITYLYDNRFQARIQKYVLNEYISLIMTSLFSLFNELYSGEEEYLLNKVLKLRVPLSELLNRIAFVLHQIKIDIDYNNDLENFRKEDPKPNLRAPYSHLWNVLALLINESNTQASSDHDLFTVEGLYDNANNSGEFCRQTFDEMILARLNSWNNLYQKASQRLKNISSSISGNEKMTVVALPVTDTLNVWNRIFSTECRKKLLESKIDEEKLISKASQYLLMKNLNQTDNLFLKQMEFFRYHLKERTLESAHYPVKNATIYCLRRWSSFTPYLPRPAQPENKGGGFFVVWTPPDNKRCYGVVVDPGITFLENFYAEGFSLEDIDAILITHSHIDHMGHLEAIYALLNDKKLYKDIQPIKLIASETIVKSYPKMFLNSKIFDIIELSPSGSEHELTMGLKVRAIPAYHSESGDSEGEQGYEIMFICGDNTCKIAFTGDTAFSCLSNNNENDPYSDCDIVIANISHIPFAELRQQLPLNIDAQQLAQHLLLVTGILPNDKEITPEQRKTVIEAISGLWYGKVQEVNGKKVDLSKETNYTNMSRAVESYFSHQYDIPVKKSKKENILGYQLYLSGIVDLWQRMYENWKNNGRERSKMLVITEFREFLGSMRNKVASFLESEFFRWEDKESDLCQETSLHKPRLTTLTGDVGLAIRVNLDEDIENKELSGKLTVRCSQCRLNNEATESDMYHRGGFITECNIRNESEGIFYFCRRHAPGAGNREFVQSINRYHPFALR